jgi:Rrf2 family protein
MFGLTKKVDYGLLLISGLFERRGQITPLAEIAAQKRIPLSFLSQVAVQLKNAGIIDSKEGKGGGYFLKKDPSEIRVTEVVESLEGRLSLTRCGVGEHCPSKHYCTLRRPLSVIEARLKELLASYTLNDLVSGRV